MSIAEIERFVRDLTYNEALRAEAEKQTQTFQATPMDRMVAFAATKGYAFTANEVRESATSGVRELTDEELSSVAGGNKTQSQVQGQAQGSDQAQGQASDMTTSLLTQLSVILGSVFR